MSQLSEISGDNCAVPTKVEAAREKKLARSREHNRLMWANPPVGKTCDCGEPATLWNSARDAVCARCDYLYSMAKRMEIQGRMIGLNRNPKANAPIVEIQMEMFLPEVVYQAEEITVVGHGVYHLRIEKEAA